MDVPFTPHDDRPRSTPEPLQSYHRHEQTVAAVTVSMVHPDEGQLSDNERVVTTDIPVVMVHPSDGQLSDSDRDGMTDADARNRSRVGFREGVADVLGPINNDEGDEREDSGRPNSAPARTPTTAGPSMMDVSEPRPRVIHPQDGRHLERGTVEPVCNPTSRTHQNASPDDLDSSDLQEDPAPERYSELSSGPGGEPQYQCHFCRYCTPSLVHMQDHLSQHTGEKPQLRRSRRQHQRMNPTSMLHCDKCQFSTMAPRRMREHYSFQHNQDFGVSARAASMFLRTSSFTNPNFSRMSTGNGTDGGYYLDLSGSRPIGSYRLVQPRGSVPFDPGDSSAVMSGCANGAFAPPAGLASFRNHSERMAPSASFPPNTAHLTLEYLFGHPRVSASSTITSCEYPARPANPHRPDLNNFSPLRGSNSGSRDMFSRQSTASPCRNRSSMCIPQGEGVKVKREPVDCDGVSDVTSSGVSGLFDRERAGPEQDRPQRTTVAETTTSNTRNQRPLFDPIIPRRVTLEQSDEIATSADVSRVSQSSEAASSHLDTGAGSAEDSEQEERRGSVGGGDSLGHHLLYNVKSETSNVAVQCSGSSTMKSESVATVTVAAAEHSTEGRHTRHMLIERGVQCEILSSTPRRLTARTLSTDSEQQSVSGSDTRCSHCGITFDDEVLFSIHIGCHSHTDPFVCNVCGKKCQNKYGFYSHIMRGHHF